MKFAINLKFCVIPVTIFLNKKSCIISKMIYLSQFDLLVLKTNLFQAETVAYPEIVLTEGLNWWIIGGAILAGLLLLILLIVILYKCGFFKRKRVSNDPTLSGNLQKRGESENLLANKQKYLFACF